MNGFFLTALGLLTVSLAVAQPTLPPSAPPLGWTSHLITGSSGLESDIRTNADFLARHLKPYGWQYVIVDARWAQPEGNASPAPPTINAHAVPPTIDAHGRLLPDESRFPSAKGGLGLRPLASYLHGLGLKFGLHVMRGVPRQAVRAKTPILGTDGITADKIADTVRVCPWSDLMYGIDMSKPGAQAYYNSLLELYGQWNVDYLLFDDMGLPDAVYYADEVTAVRKAIDELHRPILLSIAPAQPVSNSHLHQQANLFRLPGDAGSWTGLRKQLLDGVQWTTAASANHWPEAGTLRVDKAATRRSAGAAVPLTDAEQRTQMTFWCMLKAALTAGGHLPGSTPFALSLLTNGEALTLHQNATNTQQVSQAPDLLIWTSDAPDGQTKNVAIFNLGEADRTVELDLKTVGIPKKANIRDVWDQAYRGQFKKLFSHPVKAHDAVLLRVTPVI